MIPLLHRLEATEFLHSLWQIYVWKTVYFIRTYTYKVLDKERVLKKKTLNSEFYRNIL